MLSSLNIQKIWLKHQRFMILKWVLNSNNLKIKFLCYFDFKLSEPMHLQSFLNKPEDDKLLKTLQILL